VPFTVSIFWVKIYKLRHYLRKYLIISRYYCKVLIVDLILNSFSLVTVTGNATIQSGDLGGRSHAELMELCGTGRQCVVCGRHLSTKQNLERHLLLHTGDRPFTCQHCGRTFTQKTHLKSHMIVHMKNQLPMMQ